MAEETEAVDAMEKESMAAVKGVCMVVVTKEAMLGSVKVAVRSAAVVGSSSKRSCRCRCKTAHAPRRSPAVSRRTKRRQGPDRTPQPGSQRPQTQGSTAPTSIHRGKRTAWVEVAVLMERAMRTVLVQPVSTAVSMAVVASVAEVVLLTGGGGYQALSRSACHNRRNRCLARSC